MTLSLVSFSTWLLPGGSRLSIVILWVSSPNSCFYPDGAQVMPNIKAVLKEKRHTKISSCSLKAEGGKKRWLNPLFCLGLERGGGRRGRMIRSYGIMRFVWQITQENHILLATPNRFRSFWGVTVTFFFWKTKALDPPCPSPSPFIQLKLWLEDQAVCPELVKYNWMEVCELKTSVS